MKCTNCGTVNFDVAVKCARCHASLANKNPIYRTSEPEPPTQISGYGFEKVRFGPAPVPNEEYRPKKNIRPPSQAKPIQKQQQLTPPVSVITKTDEHTEPNERTVVLYGILALTLGLSLVFLIVDFYSFFLHVQNR